ncbi:testis-expressed protein 51 isoform X2 [Pantherophis guttatus]|uniref:Testis-expressed protein 51 isoform X2 n=1 Tax=Pantherophis guttatus TaxID=94885 RepID=A0A6P9C7A2_PANGU|nr:testis-expressed protein 51 isoform X2 [Pantherophis guttatus]
MATASLLGLLLWAAPVKLAGTCLRCWPDAAAYFIYDANLLLQKDSAASDQLGTLFLGNVKELASYGSGYLEREHMEREAGNLFHHLELIIQKSQTNHEVLMKEAEMEKADFIKRLEEASNLFVKEICSFSCGPNIVAAVLISLTVLLGVLGVAMWYCCRKKTSEETESQDEDDDDKDNEDDSSGTSEGSEKSEEAALTTSVPYYSNPPETDMPSPPEFDVPSPPEFDMPSPPEYDMPNPPEYDIPSPPNF